MDVVGDAQGVGDGQQKRVGLLNGLVLRELLNELVRLGGIAAAKDGTAALLDKSDFVAPGSFLPKVEAVLFGDQAKMDRLTETRGSRVCPAFFHASLYSRICSACWM